MKISLFASYALFILISVLSGTASANYCRIQVKQTYGKQIWSTWDSYIVKEQLTGDQPTILVEETVLAVDNFCSPDQQCEYQGFDWSTQATHGHPPSGYRNSDNDSYYYFDNFTVEYEKSIEQIAPCVAKPTVVNPSLSEPIPSDYSFVVPPKPSDVPYEDLFAPSPEETDVDRFIAVHGPN